MNMSYWKHRSLCRRSRNAQPEVQPPTLRSGGRRIDMLPAIALSTAMGERMPAGRETDDESLEDLGELQREVVQVVWAHAPVTAEAVREHLSRPLKESTVRTVLRRLEEKGYIAHTIDGRTFVYDVAAPRGQVAARAVRRIIDWVCNGSVEEVLVGMVDSNMIDWKQLRMLAARRGRRKRRRK
jgi:BlaI family transcriptional regulator, penicillinase repressor